MTTSPIPPSLSETPRRGFVATFKPHPRWSEAIQRHAGVRCKWRPAWLISEGVCRGQVACIPEHGAAPGLSWAPSGELVK